MGEPSFPPADAEDAKVLALYRKLLAHWNRRDAAGMAALFAVDGHIVGFDGSSVNGRAAIEQHLAPIFAQHPTPAYVAKLRGIRGVGPGVAVLRAVAGMVPQGKSDINPALNAVQTLVASQSGGRWCIEMFQSTPAAFHGRPDSANELTEELRELLRGGVQVG